MNRPRVIVAQQRIELPPIPKATPEELANAYTYKPRERETFEAAEEAAFDTSGFKSVPVTYQDEHGTITHTTGTQIAVGVAVIKIPAREASGFRGLVPVTLKTAASFMPVHIETGYGMSILSRATEGDTIKAVIRATRKGADFSKPSAKEILDGIDRATGMALHILRNC